MGGAAEAVNAGEGDVVVHAGKTFKPLAGWGAQFDYAGFVQGGDGEARLICLMAVVALNGAKSYYEEKHDKATFIKSIIMDNILLGDIYVRAKELHFVSETPRAGFLIRQTGQAEAAAIDVVQRLFPDGKADYVISTNETDITIVKQIGKRRTPRNCTNWQKACRTFCGRSLASKRSSASGRWFHISGSWRAPIKRPALPLRWERFLTPRNRSSTMKTLGSAA
jgi:hypothetical protein